MARQVRIADGVYDEPFPHTGAQVYPTGTLLVSVTFDDGDRFVTAASPAVLAAFEEHR